MNTSFLWTTTNTAWTPRGRNAPSSETSKLARLFITGFHSFTTFMKNIICIFHHICKLEKVSVMKIRQGCSSLLKLRSATSYVWRIFLGYQYLFLTRTVSECFNLAQLWLFKKQIQLKEENIKRIIILNIFSP